MKRLAVCLLPSFLDAALRPERAMAQAQLVRADLAPNSHLLVSVGTVRFWFDEPLDPALSHIVILNRQGHQVSADTGALNPQQQ